MSKRFVLRDPGSHEHVVKFNARTGKARFKFLDTDVFLEKEVASFHTLSGARFAATMIMRKAREDEFDQLEILEVEPALAQTARYIPRVDSPQLR